MAAALAVAGLMLQWVPPATLAGAGLAGVLAWLAGVALLPGTGPWTLAWLAAAALASCAWSVDVGQTLFTAASWMGVAALGWTHRRTRHALMVAAAVGVLALAGVCVWQALWGFQAVLENTLGDPDQASFARTWASRARVMGPFTSPDMLAGVLVCVVPVLLAWQTRHRGLVLLRGLAVVSGGLALLGTQSMAGVLALGVAVLTCVGTYLLARGRGHWLAGAAVLTGLVFWGVVQVRGQEAAQRLEVSFQERAQDYGNAIQLASHSPWLGVGGGAFESAFNAWSPQGRRYSAFAHNGVLQVAVELGWPCALLLVGSYLVLGWTAWRRSRRSLADAWAGTAVVAGCLHHQLDFDLHSAALSGLALATAVLLWRRPGMAVTPSRARPAVVLLAGVAVAWLAVGTSLVQRGVPRLQGDAVALPVTELGAALLWFDARSHMAAAEDVELAGGEPNAVLAEYVRHVRRAGETAPLLPAGPMMEARALATRRLLPEAMDAYNRAMVRACCSKRLHRERQAVAQALGMQAVAEEDAQWLSDHP